MATRHNTCINPACGNDVSGWGGGSTPARTAVAGFPRSWAARYTEDGAIVTARGAAVAGQTYTASMYVRDVIGWGGTCWIEWLDASLNTVTFTAGSFSLTAGTVTRVSVTATAPANTAWARLVMENMREGSLSNTADCTALLIEQSASAGVYFDGDSASASWDGTPGNSASTLSDTVSSSSAAVDTLTTGESLARAVAAPRPALDAVTTSDAPTVVGALARTAQEALGAAETLTATAAHPRVTVDALTTAGAVTRALAAPASLAENITLTGTTTRAPQSLTRATTDALRVTDRALSDAPLPDLTHLGGTAATTSHLGGTLLDPGLGGSLT